MTRKLVAYVLTSLDGAVEDPRRYFPQTDATVPGPPVFDAGSEAIETAVIDAQDTVLLGRRMYDEWSAYWPTCDVQPFADFINTVPKYVFTSTPLTSSWQNAQAVHEPAEQFVRRLKEQPGRDIGIHGSITLVRSLLATGLIDELVLGIGPVLDPQGRRLFDEVSAWSRLHLVSATPSEIGTLWVRYRTSA